MKCPCENCITLAICRHRDYHDMLSHCKLVDNLLYLRGEGIAKRTKDFNHMIIMMRDILKPTDWYIDTSATNYLIFKYSER